MFLKVSNSGMVRTFKCRKGITITVHHCKISDAYSVKRKYSLRDALYECFHVPPKCIHLLCEVLD